MNDAPLADASGDYVPPGFVIEDEEIIADFIVEASEFLQQLDQDLITLEQTPEDPELLNSIFRAVHTIKGNASFLGFGKLTRFTHQLENVLDKLRSGDKAITPEIMDLILESVDTMKVLMTHLQNEGAVAVDALIVRLEACLLAPSEAENPTEELLDDLSEIVADFALEAQELLEQADQALLALETAPDDLERLNEVFRSVHTIKGNAAFLGFPTMTAFTHQFENVLDKLRSGALALNPPLMDLILEAIDALKSMVQALPEQPAVADPALLARLQAVLLEQAPAEMATPVSAPDPLTVSGPVKPDAPSAPAAQRRKEPEEQTIRVGVERLDTLMNLAGELVIAKNRLQQFVHRFEDRYSDSELLESLTLTTTLINYVTGQFQEAVMKTRMMPIRKVFSRVPRLVRDLARDTRKQVKLVLEGEDTELDKSVIEHIGDPLVHIIRNAVDHGLEYPDARTQQGKPAEGTLVLRAYPEGNYILIEIQDDGKGMDPHMILRKAIEKKLVSPEDASRLSETEMLDFIFAPGFSTAESISNISGRGVGMNVVKENIQRLDGLIEIDSKVGMGTLFKIRLPLTMAIAPALLVRVAEQTFALPLNNVIETLVISPEDIYTMDQRQVIYLRDRVIALHPLAQVLNVPPGPPPSRLYTIIVGVGEQRMGLLVDRLLGQEEVVIKSLGGFFETIDAIAGATIMGDGSVVLILDVGALVQRLSRKPTYSLP
jgi:two-component system chemotaxis sensor kinase CheA